MKITAKNLILDLLLAAPEHTLSVRDLIAACALFGLSGNSTRVSLVRLSAAGLLEAAGRGSYRLGPQASGLARDIVQWRMAEQRLRPWQGGFIAVLSHSLGRSDRQALRQRERALDMMGFRELERGLFIRPDNIEASLAAVRLRLHNLGLEPEALVFMASDFDAGRTADIQTLWDTSALDRAYRQQCKKLEDWLAQAPELEPDVAARESYLLGKQAIRMLVFDPLLPAPLVDAKAREAFMATVRRFDQAGHAAWQRLYQLQAEDPAAEKHPPSPSTTRRTH